MPKRIVSLKSLARALYRRGVLFDLVKRMLLGKPSFSLKNPSILLSVSSVMGGDWISLAAVFLSFSYSKSPYN